MTDISKDGIRAAARASRRALSREEVSEKSRAITELIIKLPEFKTARTVMSYISAFKEPDTRAVIDHIIVSGKRAVVPVSNTEDCTITPSYLLSANGLVKGAYGIQEPAEIIPARKKDIDLAFIPGVAFDRRGMRVGFGKGYYDRFLADFGGIKIGICYDFQIFDIVPASEYDVGMDMIITEKGIYNDF